MAVFTPTSLAIIGFLTWYILSSVATWRRLRHIPGPKLGSFSYLWVAFKAMRGRGMDYEHLRKYGSLVRVSPNYIIADDPDIIRQINGSRTMNRHEWYNGAKVDPDEDSLLTKLEIKSHDERKSRTSFGYSGRDGMDFEIGVDNQIKDFIDIIRTQYLSKAGQVVQLDFAHFIRYFTLDVITDLAYGRRFEFMRKGDQYGYTESVEKLLIAIAVAGDVPLLRRILTSDTILRLVAPKPTDADGMGRMLGDAHKIVDEQLEKPANRPNMISAFASHGLKPNEVKAEVFLQIIAGSDTTATAIRSTMLYIMSTPRVYQKLKMEIKEAIASGKASSPIRSDEAKQLPYLQAVIHEGLRMRPPATYGFYKVVPSGGMTIQGHSIPSGTAVGWNLPAMTRLESIFGQDAQVFRPERFLDCDEAKKHEMMRTIDLLFGYGRWMCAGKTLAFTELNKIFFELLRAFEWQSIYPANAIYEQASTAWVQKHMWVAITEAADL